MSRKSHLRLPVKPISAAGSCGMPKDDRNYYLLRSEFDRTEDPPVPRREWSSADCEAGRSSLPATGGIHFRVVQRDAKSKRFDDAVLFVRATDVANGRIGLLTKADAITHL